MHVLITKLGDGYWKNNNNKSVSHEYPYLTEILEIIEKSREERKILLKKEAKEAYNRLYKQNTEKYKEKVYFLIINIEKSYKNGL